MVLMYGKDSIIVVVACSLPRPDRFFPFHSDTKNKSGLATRDYLYYALAYVLHQKGLVREDGVFVCCCAVLYRGGDEWRSV